MTQEKIQGKLILNFTANSDRGLVRDNNEDSAYAGPHILAIADGMGGHAAGEVASQLMVTRLGQLDADPNDNDMLALLGGVADDANHEIAANVKEHPETDGMGTTLTAVMFNGQSFGMIHVGDSRGYRLRDGRLTQLTIDDTFVQSLVDDGKLDPEDVSSHPQKSLILKAYTGRPVEPTLTIIDALPGDRLLLCSDGLSDPVTTSTIEDALKTGTPADASRRLIELALRSGGPDNISVVIADVIEEASLDEAARTALATNPVTAGALLGDLDDGDRPDTAANRAALLNRQSKSIPPESEAQGIPVGATEFKEESKSNTFRLSALIIGLLVIIGLVGAGWWAFAAADRTYFVATASSDHLIIEHGVHYSVFGRELHSPYQQACLNERGGLQLVDVGSTEDCSPFKLQDLPESTRASVAGLDNGSYDEVTQQLRRLADEALPVCLNLPTQPEDSDADNTGDLSRPGVNCREVS